MLHAKSEIVQLHCINLKHCMNYNVLAFYELYKFELGINN